MVRGQPRKKPKLSEEARLGHRKWMGECLDAGVLPGDLARLAVEKGLSKEFAFKVARERRILAEARAVGAAVAAGGSTSVEDLSIVQAREPCQRVDVSSYPASHDDLKKWIGRNYGSPQAIAMRFESMDQVASSGVGVARIQAIRALEEMIDKYAPPGEGESESIQLLIIPDADDIEEVKPLSEST